MSFEDDMIEYGFTDGNDYMDFLMDEADRIYECQQIQNAESEEYERWLNSLTHEDIKEMALEEKREKEEREKLRLAERQDKIEKELILKLWAKENPQKARLWYAHYSGTTGIDNSDFEDFINHLGTVSVESHYDIFWTGYNEWKTWLEEHESYEEFKTKAHTEWKHWSSSVYETFFKEALGYIFEGVYKNKAIILNNYFKKWLINNDSLWKNVESKYNLSKTKNEYLLQGWIETVNWNDKFIVWKYLNPDKWKMHKKEWKNQIPLYLWIKEHKFIWEEWLKEHSVLWNKYYKSHYDLLWYIYTENAYCDRDIFEDYMGIVTIDPRNRFCNKNISEEELHLTLITEYKQKIEEDKNKASYIKKNCSECGLNNFFFEFNEYGSDTEEKPEAYANRKLLELWIKEHRNQWNKWKYRTLWNNEYNNEKSFKYVSYETNIYLKVWKELYPQKWNKWKNYVFKQWKHYAQTVDRWYLWILDGNIFTFEQWARKNIGKWKKELAWAMDWDMQFAFYNLFNTSIDFKEWRLEKPEEWKFWKEYIEEQLLINKWLRDNSSKSYPQNYLLKIKINETRYLHEIRGNLFYEHMAIIEDNGKYGYCNDKGELVTPIIFDDAKNFENGIAAVNIGSKEYYEDYGFDDYYDTYNVGGLWGLINKEGQYIIEPSYDYISNFKNGYAIYSKGGELFPNIEDNDEYSLDNEKVHIINSKYGILDITGKEVVPPIYSNIKFLRNGLCAAKLDDNVEEKWIVISPSGEIIIHNKYSNIYSSTNDSMIVVVDGTRIDEYKYSQGKWGIIDNKGNFIKDLQDIDPDISFELVAKLK